ncbi:hypothetical protein [Actinomadura rupiterrae]|uniref:hypothetical protein n=1 Tax=Actinomadura rupiterrae TaxID=559627 RepID=UPI0020A3C22E|nr:hypothetical protein [Actinomadura rupiterrae]MCP2341826.1 hypothetical protein [Actinomadura rupiterrae]
MDIKGDFEIHLTVAGPDAPRARAAAAASGLKLTLIELARGRTPAQPMLSLRRSGAFGDVLAEADRTAAGLRADGLDVVRVKVEAAPWNDGVPRTDAAGEALGSYFEHHVKLLLDPDADLAGLTRTAVAHGAHVSRNVRRVRPDGRPERFVTQRCHRVGAPTATARLDALVEALRAASYEIVEVEREYVVHDDTPSLDDGWITEETR